MIAHRFPHGVLAVLALLALTSLLTGAAEAGFIPGTLKVDYPDWEPGGGPPPWAGPPEFVYELVGEHSEKALMGLTEKFGGPEPLAHVFSGRTDEDPVMNINKAVTNDSGFAWTGYRITLDPLQDPTFTGTPTSDKFTLISQTPHELVFGLPEPVLVGQSVSFNFDVNIPSTGNFGFTLTQQPVPEPATWLLLASGAAGLLLWRRTSRN